MCCNKSVGRESEPERLGNVEVRYVLLVLLSLACEQRLRPIMEAIEWA